MQVHRNAKLGLAGRFALGRLPNGAQAGCAITREDPARLLATNAGPAGSRLFDQNRFRLAPEPRPATDAEPRLQSLVLLPVLQRRPDEQATDEKGGAGRRAGRERSQRHRACTKECPTEVDL